MNGHFAAAPREICCRDKLLRACDFYYNSLAFNRIQAATWAVEFSFLALCAGEYFYASERASKRAHCAGGCCDSSWESEMESPDQHNASLLRGGCLACVATPVNAEALTSQSWAR